MDESLLIRSATETDAASLLAIYRPFVETSAVSFEVLVPTVEEFATRIRKALDGWEWLVAEQDGRCVGYAYASSHRDRQAYRWSVEVSAYVHQDYREQGIGRALYSDLFPRLTTAGFCNAYAGITLPNEASLRLHRSAGFQFVGTFRAVGRKFGQWHDVAWFHLVLRESPLSEESS